MEIRKAEIGELQALMKKELKDIYPERELDSMLKVLFMHITGLRAAQLALEKERVLAESELFLLQVALNRLKQHVPLQYVTRVAHFYGLEFKVDERVLIPRPETEELVATVIEKMSSDQRLKVLDIGTGSGCIAISIKKNLPSAGVHAVDISSDALEIARENAESINVDVQLKQLDILDAAGRSKLPSYDIIVSNPPYVTFEDKDRMLPNVTEHEPALALFVEDDPLLFYKAIVTFSKEHLNMKGHLFFECNEAFAVEVATLLIEEGFRDVKMHADMQGKDRIVLGSRR